MGNSILNSNIPQPSGQQNPGSTISPSMIQQFNQFRSSFTGNPQNTVMNMLRQGVMSNAQFQQLSQMAQQFQNFIR